jgi:flagellin-like hook-associated protein FlgL
MKIGGFNPGVNQYYEENNKKIEKALAKIATDKPILEDGSSKILYDQLLNQLNSINQGTQNLNDATGYLRIADKTLNDVSKTLSSVKGDLVRLNNGALNDSQKNAIKSSITNQLSSIQRSVDTASYAGKNIFNSGSLSFNDGKGSVDINVDQIKTAGLNEDIEEVGATNPYANFESKLDSFNAQLQQSQSSIGAGLNYVESTIRSNLTESVSIANSASNFDTSSAEDVSELKNALTKKDAQVAFINAHRKSVLEKAVAKLFV